MAQSTKAIKTKAGKSLLENAADVLAASIARSRPSEDAFGLGKTLGSLGKTLVNGGSNIIDLGPARFKSDEPFPDFTAGVPRAQYPGAPPPVGVEPMPRLNAKANQQKLGTNDEEGDEGEDPDYDSIRDRTSQGYDDVVTPGEGNVLPPWAKHESYDLNELNSYIDFDDVEEDLDPTLVERLDTFVRAGEEGRPKSYKIVRTHTTEKPVEPGSRTKMNVAHYDVLHKTSGEKIGSFKHESGAPKAELETKLHNVIKKHHGLPTWGRPRSTTEALETIVANILTEKQPELAEDIDAMFAGETLSKELKSKITTIFETAVTTRVKSVTEKLEKVAMQKMDEAIEGIKEELTEKVDEYLNYMVEEWIKENEIAIEKGLKAELVEDFMAGLRNLFLENYIDVPEAKVDLVEELSAKISELEESLNQELSRNIDMKKQMKEQDRNSVLEKVIEGLTEIQADKLANLSESLAFTTAEEFETKLKTIKESYFVPKTKKPTLDALNEDSAEVPEGPALPIHNTLVAQYAQALSKMHGN